MDIYAVSGPLMGFLTRLKTGDPRCKTLFGLKKADGPDTIRLSTASLGHGHQIMATQCYGPCLRLGDPSWVCWQKKEFPLHQMPLSLVINKRLDGSWSCISLFFHGFHQIITQAASRLLECGQGSRAALLHHDSMLGPIGLGIVQDSLAELNYNRDYSKYTYLTYQYISNIIWAWMFIDVNLKRIFLNIPYIVPKLSKVTKESS